MMSTANVSFKFKKTSKVQIVNSTNNDQDETKDFIYDLEGIKSSLPIAEVKKKEVTIPWTPKIWRSGGKLDVSSLPEAPTLEQYEQVPVEGYGLAMLRKMGWKPGEGSGKKAHHCQNCGKIFCHECSSKQATVASSKKPVRVCDTCFKEVLNH